MKIQIDTKEQTIAVEQNIKLNELIEALDRLFPKGEWKEYTLKTETIINWNSPIYIDRWEHPWYPWWNPVYYDGTGTVRYSGYDNHTLTVHQPPTYCVEV
jgi:hypothetical protein